MIRKTFMAAIVISALLVSTLAGALIVEVAKANPVPWQTTPNKENPTFYVP